MTWILVGWLFSGFLGWGWMNYSAFQHDGPDDDPPPLWLAVLVALLVGPVLVFANALECRKQGVIYLGLRYP